MRNRALDPAPWEASSTQDLRLLPTPRLLTTGAAHRRAQRLMHAAFERNAQPLCLPRQALDLRDAASCGAVSAAAVRSLSHALPQMTHLHLGALRSGFWTGLRMGSS